MLWSKNANFFVYVDLVKIGLEIMRSDFAQDKGTFLTLKTEFFKVQKIAFLGLTHAFDHKILISSLVRFHQNKTIDNA